jgi:hypothetical protein
LEGEFQARKALKRHEDAIDRASDGNRSISPSAKRLFLGKPKLSGKTSGMRFTVFGPRKPATFDPPQGSSVGLG